MSAALTLTPEQFVEFDRRGILCLRGSFSVAKAHRALAYVQARLARLGLWKDGTWRLDSIARPQWPATGLKPSQAIGNDHPDVEALLEDPAVQSTVEALMGGCAYDTTIYKRPQVLFTLPNADTWTVPAGWHVDLPRLASGTPPGVQLFLFLDAVEPRGGGTLAIAGSHRLLNDGRFLRVKELKRLLCRDAFFREMYGEGRMTDEDGAHLLGKTGIVEGVDLEVVELTGAPGDAYVMDLRVLHTAAPNAASRPRTMATHRFVRPAFMQELAKSLEWE